MKIDIHLSEAKVLERCLADWLHDMEIGAEDPETGPNLKLLKRALKSLQRALKGVKEAANDVGVAPGVS